MKSSEDLRRLLQAIDHKGYPAYKDTKGIYQFPGYQLSIDHVQGDPFASPSSLSVKITGKQAGFPGQCYGTCEKRVALQDYLLRAFYKEVEKYNFKARGSGKSGLISVSRCGQEILERTGCHLDGKNGDLTIRMEVGFPANGRTINAGELIRILFDFLPACVRSTCFYPKYDERRKKEVEEVKNLTEDQTAIRSCLTEMGLTAFVANGSILPRQSGVSSRPMKDGIPFESPASMEVELKLPHRGNIKGMGIKKGITLIVGGGYHGKSTLLEALELGVYDHIAGDGREYVASDQTALKLRAEDGRSVQDVDISLFINHLPNGKDTLQFCTEDASGSTSQAANVVEGIEAGSHLFLIDEDTSATNFMIRDELMQRVVSRDKEPITPFIERIRELYERFGISTIVVAGSSGAYFHVADRIIQMERYIPKDITDFAKETAKDYPAVMESPESGKKMTFARRPLPDSAFRQGDRVKIKVLGKDSVMIQKETIDMRYVEQLVDPEQLYALGCMMKYMQLNMMDGKKTMQELVEEVLQKVSDQGLFVIADQDGLALPRRQEIFAFLNRYRPAKFRR